MATVQQRRARATSVDMAARQQRTLVDLARWESDAVLLLVKGELPLMAIPPHLLAVTLSPPPLVEIKQKNRIVYKRKQ